MRPDDRPHGVRRRRGRHLRARRAAGRCSTRRTTQGRLVREGDPEWRDDVPVRVETIPVRRGGPGDRGDRPQHQPARRPHPEPAGADLPADRRRPGPDDRRRATSRSPGQRSDHADSPAGRRRLRPARRRRAGSPTPARTRCRSTAGSGSSGDLDRRCRWPTLTRELVPPRRRPDEETLSAVLGGRAHRDTEVGDRRRSSLIVRSIPLRPHGRAHRRAGAGARRHRAAPPRPRAGHQGRDHPGDPPPGEEQPADGRRAAAAAGPADRRPRGAGGAGGGGAPGRLDRDRARDAEPGRSTSASTSTRSPTGSARWSPR